MQTRYFLSLMALLLGIIALLTGMHFIVAIMLSVIMYRERLTMPRTLAAVLFMK